MRIISFQVALIIVLFASIYGCKKPYNPPATSTSNSYLVVEGIINSGADSTVIKLSRTVNIASKITVNPLVGAIVTVESNQNNIYTLKEITSGSYASPGLNLNGTLKYRLRIITAENKQYLSDFIPVLNSPPIDSINFVIQSKGLAIFSNTHDLNNNTRYYRWDYTETWIFHSKYSSNYKSNGDTVLLRKPDEQVYHCWGSDTSSSILLNSSIKLVNDVISRNPITFVPSTSEKVGTEYSILVRQYALTSEAYTFWTNLKKNTEQLGSIFDALPSEISGNIHALGSTSEPVIGYMSVGSTSSQRIFIQNSQLPAWLPALPYDACLVDTALYAYYSPGSINPVNLVDEYFNYNKGGAFLIPIDAISQPGMPQPIGYTGSSAFCVDCTLRGTNKQPLFWKY